MPTRQLVVLSGKGGTGKTTVTASFFALADSVIAADCDVDAPNLHLLLNPEEIDSGFFRGSYAAVIDESKCTRCGICEENCPFGAIEDCRVNHLLCEGCGVCTLVCPEDAVEMEHEVTGRSFISETSYGPLVHGLLFPGSEATGKLVTETKRMALEVAGERGLETILVDGSPGIGCPVIASVAGADLVLAVAEPTRSGLWGLERISGVADHFEVPMEICLNKADINSDIAAQVRSFASSRGTELIGEIPFDEEVNSATSEGKVLVEEYGGPAAVAVRSAWEKTLKALLDHAKRR